MARHTPNPMDQTFLTPPPPISKKTFPIAGILTTVYGLDEQLPEIKEVACLWLLHPRLQTQSCMDPVAAMAIHDWNEKLRAASGAREASSLKGLVAVSFDQRNHGSRLVDKLANEPWRGGNPRHAQDMFSVYHGTALDTSLLLTHLASYIYPSGAHTITTNLVLGVSLGGHAAWQILLQDPRFAAAIVIIGCPDYVRLMTHRAEKSKLKTWLASSPPGARFLGSSDFPPSLVDAVREWDPAGILLTGMTQQQQVSDSDARRLRPIMEKTLKGKRVLCLSGGADKLVPYPCSKPLLDFLKDAIKPGGWFADGDLKLEDHVYEGIGHDTPYTMMVEAVRFIRETLTEHCAEKGSKL